MNRILERLAYFSVQQRGYVCLVLLTVSAVACLGYFDPNFFNRIQRSLITADKATKNSEGVEDQQEVTSLPDVTPVALSRADAVVVVEAENFFTPRAAEAMRAVVDRLESLDQVQSVLWMDRVPVLNIFGLPEPLLPRVTASQMRFDSAEKKAHDHPLVGGQLLSADGHTTLLMVNFNFYHVLGDEDATIQLRESAEQAAAEFPDVPLRFRITGAVPASIAAISSHEANQLKYQLIGYGMILLITTILFRGIRAVLVVALAPILGVFWTVGFVRFFGYDNNPLINVILPILVSLVGLTDGVHLMVQIRKLRATGLSVRDAAQKGLSQVGLACFLTSLTTAIGFGSLMLADSVWVRQFGECCTVGVVLAFIAVVTSIPLACSTGLGRNIHKGLDKSPIDRNLTKVSVVIDWVLKNRIRLSVFSVLATIVLLAVSLTLRPDQRLSDGLPQNAEATQAMQHVDRAFGGLEVASVKTAWSPEIKTDSAEILEVVGEVESLLESEPLIGRPISIYGLLKSLPGEGSLSERMSMLDLLPPPLKRAFYVPETRTADTNFRVQDLGIATYGPVFERLEAGLEDISLRHPGFQLRLEGRAVDRWKNLYQIVVDLAASLGTASVIIFLVLTVVYRSLRLGLISIIPNLFPLAFTAACLSLAGYNLEVVMVCNFTVCLGVAVDDTIHFLTRFREEQEKTSDDDQAIQRAFTGVGTALIMTTLVLVSGFSVVIFSDSRDHKIFAMMGALTIAAALFCDLIFLPALLSWLGERPRPIKNDE